MRRISAALLILATPVLGFAASPPDPLVVFLQEYVAQKDARAVAAPASSPTQNGERLAKVQSDLAVAAAGLEALRSPVHAQNARQALTATIDPSVAPFFKDRDSSLDAIYRTLAVVDLTWALRFPEPPCSPRDQRASLLSSADGLFSDPKSGTSSPWLEALLGPAASGRTGESALDRASAETKLSSADYERLRIRAANLTRALESDRADGSARAKLYCERADAYSRLAASHRLAGATLAGATLAGRFASSNAMPGVFLIAAAEGDRYRALGAAFPIKTDQGDRVVTDAAIIQGHDHLVLFARPDQGQTLAAPLPFTLARAADGFGPAVGRAEGLTEAGLPITASLPAVGEYSRSVGHINAAGPWATTQGLITAASRDTYQTDAVLVPDLAGAPVFTESGEVAGLVVLQDGAPVVLTPAALQRFVGGEATMEKADATVLAARGTGSASLIESGLPSNLGGVNWEGGGGVGNFRPHTSAGPPSGYSSPKSYSSGSSDSSSEGWGSRAGTAMGDPLGEALGEAAVIGIKALFNGIGELFQPRRQAPPAIRQAIAQKAPPPPPKKPLKAVGMTLAADKNDAATGEEVELKATITFTGELGSKAGIEINLGGDSERFSFVSGSTGTTDGSGRAIIRVRVVGSANSNAKDAHDDLDRESGRQKGERTAPTEAPKVGANADGKTKLKASAASAFDKLDAEGGDSSETLPPVADSSVQNAAMSVITHGGPGTVITADEVKISATVAAGGVVEQPLNASAVFKALIGKCPPGTIAANAYGNQIDAAPGQNAPQDRLKEMRRFTECDRQEAEAESACGEGDSGCRDLKLKSSGYDFDYCPSRSQVPSSGAQSGRGAVPRGMRPFQFVRCIPIDNPSNIGGRSKNGIEDHQYSKKEDPESNSDQDKPTTAIPRPHLKYPKNQLPITGNRVYIPPEFSGAGEVVPNPQGRGYIDKAKNIWEWTQDPHAGPHWDVQHSDGSHTNVFPDGRVLGRDNF